jgi:hypothetical protein
MPNCSCCLPDRSHGRGSRPYDADGEGKVEVARSGAAPPPGAAEHAGLARPSPRTAELDGLAAPCRAREEERAHLVDLPLLIPLDLLAPHLARGSSCLPTRSEGAPLPLGAEGTDRRRCRSAAAGWPRRGRAREALTENGGHRERERHRWGRSAAVASEDGAPPPLGGRPSGRERRRRGNFLFFIILNPTQQMWGGGCLI